MPDKFVNECTYRASVPLTPFLRMHLDGLMWGQFHSLLGPGRPTWVGRNRIPTYKRACR
jgi:hypothetical protein